MSWEKGIPTAPSAKLGASITYFSLLLRLLLYIIIFVVGGASTDNIANQALADISLFPLPPHRRGFYI